MSNGRSGVTRRDFGRILALGAPAVLVRPAPGAAARVTVEEGEPFWQGVRDQFVMPRELGVLNAANLCPAPSPVLAALDRITRSVDRDPSPANRAPLREAKEAARTLVADYLRATPGEIVITRNTSEANNLVSSGLQLSAGDEVLILSDNHPSNHAAWREKARRYGYTVKVVDVRSPHPGLDYYVDAFERQSTPRTRVWAFTHVTSSVGDVLPAAELCRRARARGILTLVDGAQTFGVLDVDLSAMQPDFYSGSAHKWPCGARESGVLYVRADALARLAPQIVSLYGGAVGASRTLETYGQRDEAAIVGFGEAIGFQNGIGRQRIEQRARQLARAMAEALRGIDGVKVWTSPDPELSAAIVSAQIGDLKPSKLADALYRHDRIGCATREGSDRPGLRFSPHLYNLPEEIDRTAAAIRKYLRTGL
jgi:selenocysteine lyase/cysteine desulfurase